MEEKRQCQNCRHEFRIEQEDFNFYEKIKVPPPTFCPECRSQRRMAWRNERTLYRRKDAFGKNVVSIYAPEVPFIVYERDYWWSNAWDPLKSGQEYDFSKSFFIQFNELLKNTPVPNVFSNNVIDSPYTNHVGYMKNCYLTFASWECENVLYGAQETRSKDISDSRAGVNNELCYETINCEKSYRLEFSQDCSSCINSAFLYDCRNCADCFGCIGLRNKQYYVFNKPYSHEQYKEKMNEYDLGSYEVKQKLQKEFYDSLTRFPRRFAQFINTVNVTGNHCRNMKNCYACFDLYDDVEDSKYVANGGLGLKDSYDGYGVGVVCELLYEGIDTGVTGYKERFSIVVYTCRDTNYCFNCENCSYLFGCVGLRNKQYCILNKQYTKEEYETLIPKIIEHMNAMPYTDKKGRVYRYGEFFPPELSPFAYNETIAQEYFPLTKEQATEQGYTWKDPEQRTYQSDIKTEDLPDHIKDVKEDIIGEVIQCAHSTSSGQTASAVCNEQCATAFKIIELELQFYKKMNLPLPRLCPNCRHYARLRQRNPLKLWKRSCMCAGGKSEIRNSKSETSSKFQYTNTAQHFHGQDKCPNEFETSYAQERPEIVYCEKCYQAEVV
ncbi:MAG: Uncharacterized protein G01um101430_674 [Parcubacteria group bacterium Gr01-1014_30]|nr:MAG: Uncharacterized protein G01um101430_674 [Parcubacteria group bacterium Gr01-1014_30]